MPRVACVAPPQIPPSFLGLVPLHDAASSDALNLTLDALRLFYSIYHILDVDSCAL